MKGDSGNRKSLKVLLELDGKAIERLSSEIRESALTIVQMHTKEDPLRVLSQYVLDVTAVYEKKQAATEVMRAQGYLRDYYAHLCVFA